MKDRLIIGRDTLKETNYNKQLELKQKMGREALSYAKEFIEVDNIAEFLNGFLEYFKVQFMEQSKNDFSKRIPLEKRLELVGFFAHKLSAYESQYNSINIELDEQLNPTKQLDYNIYLEGAERIRMYKAKMEFLDALNKYKESGGSYKPAIVQSAFNSQFLFSFSENKLTPTL